MIPTSCVKYCTVAETIPGSLVLYHHSGSDDWLSCLSVKDNSDVTLLALNFGDDDRSPFLLRNIADQHCLQLGKAEPRFIFPNPIGSRPGHLALGSSGPAIVGRANGLGSPPAEKWWLVSTGEATAIDRTALRPTAWEVGIYVASNFEKVLSFPLKH
jgi:hypothetical protein